MYLPRSRSPRKTDRSRGNRHKAAIKAKNNRRRQSLKK